MDNFYQECPGRMSDGRVFSEYKTATRRNEYIKYVNGIYNNDQYRMFLQQNGKQIMDNMHTYHLANNSCKVNPCVHTYPTRVVPGDMAEEMKKHNKRAKERYTSNKPNLGCPKYANYRLNK